MKWGLFFIVIGTLYNGAYAQSSKLSDEGAYYRNVICELRGEFKIATGEASHCCQKEIIRGYGFDRIDARNDLLNNCDHVSKRLCDTPYGVTRKRCIDYNYDVCMNGRLTCKIWD